METFDSDMVQLKKDLDYFIETVDKFKDVPSSELSAEQIDVLNACKLQITRIKEYTEKAYGLANKVLQM